MATFIKGLTDDFGPLQLYRPDYQFLTQVYGTKQAEYDRGFDMVRNLYTSQLSNALTNPENERFRQDAFKKLESSLRSVSGLDLSNGKNITYAMSLIDPISKDEDLAYDMAVTNFHARQKQKMEQYKNSTDPKVRAMYSDVSRMDIAFAEEDLRNAKRGDGSVRRVAPREFVPFEDINEHLRKAAKEEKLEIVESKVDPSGYILKRTNGAGAVPAFENWARGVMGTRFDRQLAVTGRVNAESAIRGTMSARQIGREEATRIVAEQLLPQFATAQSLRGIAAEKEYKDLDNEVKFFEKKFPNGFPQDHPEIEAEYKRLVLTRDQNKDELDAARSEVAKIQTEGPGYISGNLYGIYTNEAKQKIAKEFATGYATSKQELDIRPDTTWATKVRVASQEKLAREANKIKLAQLAQKDRELEFKMLKQEQDYNLKIKLAQNDGKLGDVQTLGTGVSDQKAFASDYIGQGIQQARNETFQSIYNGESGLLKVVLDDDNAFGRIYSSIAKVKQMAAGQQVNLSKEDLSNLKEYSEKVGVKISKIPTDPGLANELLDVFASSTYEAAVKALPKYEKTHSLHEVDLKGFQRAMVSFQSQVSQKQTFTQTMKRVGEEVLDANGNVKEIYKGAKIKGVLANGVYDIDLSGIESQAGKSRISSLIPDYNNRENPTGARLQFTKPSSAEMDALIKNPNSATTIITSEGSNIDMEKLRNLSTDELSKLFDNRVNAFYDPVKRQMQVDMNVAQGDGLAKKLGLDKPQKLTLTIPYETIQSSRGVLSRFEAQIPNNSIDPVSLESLSEFLTNPSATVKADSFKKNAGFDYRVYGVTDAKGNPQLQFTYTYTDPVSKKVITNTKNIAFQPGNVKSLKDANETINAVFTGYYNARINYDKNLHSKQK